MEKKSPAYFCCRDMQVIHSDAALQRLLTRFNNPEGWSNLAKNQYLSTSMKQKIWQRALSHRKNNPKADSAAYETSADMILSELISHGEVDDQMLLNATALIRLEDWDFLESALVSWDNLPAVVLKELQQNTPRNDIWAKFFLRQENSSRAQVDEALRVYYALDPDALAQLDVLARMPIWQRRMNFLHGTGHGVGHFLNVHEGPQSIRMNENPVTLQLGMLTSNEPGVYKAGSHGIRTENLVLVVPAGEGMFGNYLQFETVTLCPICKKGIIKELLTSEEINWLNQYHQTVYEKLSPSLNKEEQAWLKEATNQL